jgi:hypothetical protein
MEKRGCFVDQNGGSGRVATYKQKINKIKQEKDYIHATIRYAEFVSDG